MATKPGILTEWPWKPLGSFKYLILAPWVIEHSYSYLVKGEKNLPNFLIFPFMLWRMFHNQLWISLSRYRTIKESNKFLTNPFIFIRLTEKRIAVSHPLGEVIGYFVLFMIPLLTTLFSRTASISSFFGYIIFIDFMNNMGHCNFEFFPKSLFNVFPILKYIIYTPSFHSLHHTEFHTNYSLYMPFYDYIYGTMDKSTETVYENALMKRQEDVVADVVHLTHFTTLNSIYHLRFGFAHFASNPISSKWYLWLLWPFTLSIMALTWLYGCTFLVERQRFDKLTLQTWVISKYKFQYYMKSQNEAINKLIEKAIVEANEKGVKVVSLGLLNQAEELHYPIRLKTKVVDGTSLAVAIVVNSIPQGTTQLLLTGRSLTKVACAVAFNLCRRGLQVATCFKEDYEKLMAAFGSDSSSKNLLLSSNYSLKTWIVGDDLSEEEQKKAKGGTIFIPISQFPPKKFRKDCIYYTTPAMEAPPSLENVDSCENWLPRGVISAWRIDGIVHCLEGWDHVNEFGSNIFMNVNKIWEATLKHGFKPLILHQ